MTGKELLFAGFIRGHAVRIELNHNKVQKFPGLIPGKFYCVVHGVEVHKDIHLSPEFLDQIRQNSGDVIVWIDPYVLQTIEHFRHPEQLQN